MTAVERVATCACGQLQIRCTGEPVRLSVCHCLACRQRTGSVFGTQAWYPRDQVAMTGESTVWERAGDSGAVARFRFCPRCGATVYWDFPAMPDVVAVAVGCFADPTFPAPTVSVYEDRQSAWVVLGDSVVEHHR